MSQESLKEHMKAMIDRLTWNIYRVVSVALFAHHQLTFSFRITTAILLAEKEYGSAAESGDRGGGIEEAEFNTFLQGSIMASLMDEEARTEHDGKEFRMVKHKRCPPVCLKEIKGAARDQLFNVTVWRAVVRSITVASCDSDICPCYPGVWYLRFSWHIIYLFLSISDKSINKYTLDHQSV